MAKGLHKNNQIVIFSKSETKTGMKIKLFFCLIAGIVLANTATAQLGGLLKKKKDTIYTTVDELALWMGLVTINYKK